MEKVDGRDRAVLEYHARAFREGGVIQKGKRGFGAPSMTTQDAANFLIALNAGDTAPEAIEAVPQFRSLVAAYPGHGTDPLGGALDNAKTFGEVIGALIDRAPELFASFAVYLRDAWPDDSDKAYELRVHGMLRFGEYVRLRVTMSRWPVAAEIVIERYTAEGWLADWRMPYMQDVNLKFDPETLKDTGFYRDNSADRRTSVTVGLKTFLALSAPLHGGDE
jgi:hypothetical protein